LLIQNVPIVQSQPQKIRTGEQRRLLIIASNKKPTNTDTSLKTGYKLIVEHQNQELLCKN
jgi:hypothetical protein